MGFKLPGKSIQSGTSAHSSALKMVAEQKAASALKATASPVKKDWATAKKNDPNLDQYVADRKSMEKGSSDYGANQYKINKAYYGEETAKKLQDKYNKKYNITTTTKPTNVEKVEKKDGPRVVKTSSTTKDKSVYRKDGTLKKEVSKTKEDDGKGNSMTNKEKSTYYKNGKDTKKHVTKNIQKSGKDKTVQREKEKFRKDGSTKKYVYKERGPNDKYKEVAKYDKEGNVKRSKTVSKEDGRRTVTKTNKKGETKTKSRRTLKGILTGKGKKEKE
jgi:hypothetical protein